MKRRTVHVTFGAAAAVCAVLAGYEALRLREALRVNEAIAAADANVTASASAVGEGAVNASGGRGDAGHANAMASASAVGEGAVNASGGRGDTADVAAGSSLPEAQFARAVALAKRGDYEGALKHYKVLSRGSRADLATDALYNAGNLQLREALREGRDAAVRALPLIELAKQSYRGVLRRDPQSWDARYNLERALWLAPELDEVLSETITRDAENRVMSTLQSTRADLP